MDEVSSWSMLDLARCLATTLFLSWAGFAIVRSQNSMISMGRGWLWVGLAAIVAACQWPINFWLGNPLICPMIVTVLYLISLIGLAPDDSVLTPHATICSQWFQRGLAAAVAGTAGGAVLWAMLLSLN